MQQYAMLRSQYSICKFLIEQRAQKDAVGFDGVW